MLPDLSESYEADEGLVNPKTCRKLTKSCVRCANGCDCFLSELGSRVCGALESDTTVTLSRIPHVLSVIPYIEVMRVAAPCVVAVMKRMLIR